ncbi:MAG: STAS/SEC14 domain-containing protein [Chloroflexi bacterium]|nr:STAS/SEC14 domain-containing protein [Chloroflexota bacterium]MBI3740813.1 STAS/SEC14 domain-containing protein [Chloroflexota bacterium]
MPIVQVEAQLPTDELLKAVGKLSQSDLEQFVSQVIALRAKRQSPSLSHTESELLLKINQGVPAEIQKQYKGLIAKRRAETLTANEHAELLRLTKQVEKLEARRVESLAELARLRNTTLTALMKKLNIRKPRYA